MPMLGGSAKGYHASFDFNFSEESFLWDIHVSWEDRESASFGGPAGGIPGVLGGIGNADRLAALIGR